MSTLSDRELPRLTVTSAMRKGGRLYRSRDRKSGVLPVVGYQGRHSIDCNGTDWQMIHKNAVVEILDPVLTRPILRIGLWQMQARIHAIKPHASKEQIFGGVANPNKAVGLVPVVREVNACCFDIWMRV